MANGFIYILINACMPGLVKIGKTERSSERRALELSATTGVPSPFIVAFEAEVGDCDNAEIKIHTRLQKYRVTGDGEFFRLPLKEAL